MLCDISVKGLITEMNTKEMSCVLSMCGLIAENLIAMISFQLIYIPVVIPQS